MIRFECDYGEGAHPEILKALMETNMEQAPGYSTDSHCGRARELIRRACCSPDACVEFLVGGTQANVTVIAACLKPYQGVLCAESGHINVHETGALESCGYKALTLKSPQGKITAEQVREAWETHITDKSHEHMVQPGMVYLSWPTECGTLYTREELVQISQVCREYGLKLFVDGARCGYGLAAMPQVTLKDLAELTDVFYIGGTKVGAFFGEAVVITNPELKKDFRYYIKQHGGMLAKGRLLGIQFETLFEGAYPEGREDAFRETLYYRISANAVRLAGKIRKAFEGCGVSMGFLSDTNQQFPVLDQEQMEKFQEKYAFELWQRLEDGKAVVRFCTSWATREEDVKALTEDIFRICG
ncbi:MAG: aminotransferase class I/II-fold pyridoxal phosphate-dependent enzyme [Eubacteriales bacterium]|nr:aminotransferase class I/II-fold pyridoxal phosphate-dependent enzyme [Eubacteriales bacterium]